MAILSPESCKPPQLASDNFLLLDNAETKQSSALLGSLKVLRYQQWIIFFFMSCISQSLFNSMFLTMMLFNTCQYE